MIAEDEAGVTVAFMGIEDVRHAGNTVYRPRGTWKRAWQTSD